MSYVFTLDSVFNLVPPKTQNQSDILVCQVKQTGCQGPRERLSATLLIQETDNWQTELSGILGASWGLVVSSGLRGQGDLLDLEPKPSAPFQPLPGQVVIKTVFGILLAAWHLGISGLAGNETTHSPTSTRPTRARAPEWGAESVLVSAYPVRHCPVPSARTSIFSNLCDGLLFVIQLGRGEPLGKR